MPLATVAGRSVCSWWAGTKPRPAAQCHIPGNACESIHFPSRAGTGFHVILLVVFCSMLIRPRLKRQSSRCVQPKFGCKKHFIYLHSPVVLELAPPPVSCGVATVGG